MEVFQGRHDIPVWSDPSNHQAYVTRTSLHFRWPSEVKTKMPEDV